MVPPVNDKAWLTWVERDLERTTAHTDVTLPPSSFHCQVENQPDHLVPAHFMRAPNWTRRENRRLAINPACVWTVDTNIPQELRPLIPFTDQFALQGDIVWVPDRVSQRFDPFWLAPDTAENLRKVRCGRAGPEQCFTPEMLRALWLAGVLLEEGDENHRAHHNAKPSSLFQQRGFVPLRGLLHPFHISALRRYYRYLIRTGAMRFGDSQSARRYVAHNEGVARYFHFQLTAAVSALVREPVKPSYVYVASYQGGADLEKHTDRAQCEFSISLCLDFSPEPDDPTTWPLVLHPGESEISVYQRIGDGLLYRGIDIPHSRTVLAEGRSSTSIFFHYVRKDFEGTLD